MKRIEQLENKVRTAILAIMASTPEIGTWSASRASNMAMVSGKIGSEYIVVKREGFIDALLAVPVGAQRAAFKGQWYSDTRTRAQLIADMLPQYNIFSAKHSDGWVVITH